MYKAYKFKLKPTSDQAQIFVSWMGAGRWIWNQCLSQNKESYANTKKFIFRYDLSKQLPELKKTNEWLKEIPSQALQNRIIDFNTALNRVWKQGNGFPKYKSKHHEHHNTIRIDQTNGHIDPRKKQIKIPKIGWVKWNRHRSLAGKLKSITIKQENGDWFCVCLCQIDDVLQITKINQQDIVGIDLGLKEFAVTSDGEVIETPKLYRKRAKKLARLQRQHSKKQKSSNNRAKARKKLKQLHYKIKCQRSDFTHKASNSITKNYKLIGVEDLNIAGMMRNRSLAKSIQDQGWAQFVSQLEYKSTFNGGMTVKINRWLPSTKTCSSCGQTQSMPLSVRTYECSSCGMTMDRDYNAAINIRRYAIEETNRCGTHRIHACGDTSNGDEAYDSSSYVSTKQEKILVNWIKKPRQLAAR
jgi:putative transposase